ncbi:MAG: YfcC family protein, partial [Ignavibacteriae bacterium]|nr:YfcC family protein [Ignavibacteriota bacterium]
MLKTIKSIKLPHVFILLTAVVFICSALSYIIPSGVFERETKKIGSINRTLVIPGSYKELPKSYSLKGTIMGDEIEGKATPVSLIGFLSAIPKGMEEADFIIFFIFMIGGVFGILQKTGTIIAFLQKMLDTFGNSPNLLIILMMVFIGIGASTLGMGEELLPLIPLFLIVSKQLGYDRIVGVAIIWVAAEVGFAAATTNPYTVQIAQNLAQIPLNSGIVFRLVFFAFSMAISIFYVLRYGAKIKKDPAKSVMADDEFNLDDITFDKIEFKKEHFIILLVGVVLFAFIIYSVQNYDWWINEMSGAFFLLGILCVFISKMKLNDATTAFIKGMEEMVVAALVVGFARGVQVVLQDGQILDTIINSAATNLQIFPKHLAAGGMLIFQSTLNFFIPSGSGQAAVTMPLMAPIADLIGITRQTAVFAFTCGDGFSNMIIPTSGILMAVLSLAKVPFVKWLKFVFP